jgi:hypothetical protein
MPDWTGQGDAASIPAKLKNPQQFCNFVTSVSKTIGDLASSILGFIWKGEQVVGRQETAVKMVKNFLNRASGLNFPDLKANQV